MTEPGCRVTTLDFKAVPIKNSHSMPRLLLTSALLLPLSGSSPVLRQTGAATDSEPLRLATVSRLKLLCHGEQDYIFTAVASARSCAVISPLPCNLQVKRAADEARSRREKRRRESPSAPLGASGRQVSSLSHRVLNRICSCFSRGHVLCWCFINLFFHLFIALIPMCVHAGTDSASIRIKRLHSDVGF